MAGGGKGEQVSGRFGLQGGRRQNRVAVGGAFWCWSLGLPGQVQSREQGSRIRWGAEQVREALTDPHFPGPANSVGFRPNKALEPHIKDI